MNRLSTSTRSEPAAAGASTRRDAAAVGAPRPLGACYQDVRAQTVQLCAPLEPEDYVVQSMPDASPVKWHLAHTTWFFEQFALRPHLPGYRPFREGFEYLFNSYYEQVGPQFPRPARGLLTRPTTREIYTYRDHVDAAMQALLRAPQAALAAVIELGLHHEQQHQELILTDLKHLLALNPLYPVYRPRAVRAPAAAAPLRWTNVAGGLHEVGADAERFSFDNERPRHRVLTPSFVLANRLITNGEYAQFVRDGGYREPRLWLSEGWQLVKSQAWCHPCYWNDALDAEFTLHGRVALEAALPVCHLSFYEADAFARWAQARLPTEFEWELAAAEQPVSGHFLDDDLHPQAADEHAGLQQLFGDVWEWTASAYLAYPGYRPDPGALGEYNGKFMINQQVLRGGSCASPPTHLRASYRNFFPPHARWQFAGLRLAKDR